MVGAKRRNFEILTCSDLRLLQIFFLKKCRCIKLVTGESGFMVKCARKTFQSLLPLSGSSLQQGLKFLCLQCI